jgi:hypothetical protein
MRILKLVIWDLDETILTGVLEEGSESVHPAAQDVMNLLHARGTIQALATHNQPEILRPAIEKFQWTGLFAQVEADLGSKASMVGRILDTLSVSALDTVFVDSDQFERDSIAFQVPISRRTRQRLPRKAPSVPRCISKTKRASATSNRLLTTRTFCDAVTFGSQCVPSRHAIAIGQRSC